MLLKMVKVKLPWKTDNYDNYMSHLQAYRDKVDDKVYGCGYGNI